MSFAQLTYRESLRDIEICLRALESKLYHAGIQGKVPRSTLADANENRDWRIYAESGDVLIAIAKKLYAEDDFGVELEQIAYAFDWQQSICAFRYFPGLDFASARQRSSCTH